MNKVVDASVVLAVCNQEQGSDVAREAIRRAIISSVNLAEVYETAAKYGKLSLAKAIIQAAAMQIVDFNEEHALQAATIAAEARAIGLPFTSRACLALALTEGLPVVTGDKTWNELDLGITVELFREKTK